MGRPCDRWRWNYLCFQKQCRACTSLLSLQAEAHQHTLIRVLEILHQRTDLRDDSAPSPSPQKCNIMTSKDTLLYLQSCWSSQFYHFSHGRAKASPSFSHWSWHRHKQHPRLWHGTRNRFFTIGWKVFINDSAPCTRTTCVALDFENWVIFGGQNAVERNTDVDFKQQHILVQTAIKPNLKLDA